MLPLVGVVAAVAVDFLPSEDLVFWSDIEAKTLSRAHLNGTAQATIVKDELGRWGWVVSGEGGG